MKKVIPLVGALIFSSLSAKSSNQNSSSEKKDQLFERGDQGLCQKNPAAYNAPASVRLNGSCLLFATASYLYWNVSEEGLDLATTAAFNSGSGAVVPLPHKGRVVFQDIGYSSGFKVGLGANLYCDDWVIRADYTWLHRTKNTSKSAPTSAVGIGALYLTDWFFQVSPLNQGVAATNLSSVWHLGLDWLDLVLERPAYSGRRLTLTPFAGLRASWIKQSLQMQVKGALNVSSGATPLHSRNRLRSWGIGPRAGMDGHFLLGAGFKLEGELGASLLFTRFSSVSHSEDPFVVGGNSVAYAMHGYNCMRPMAEASLGFGWGMYLAKDRYHLDVRATYDFNYLWSQNMLRMLNDLEMIGTNGGAGDLSLHGLTVSVGFDF